MKLIFTFLSIFLFLGCSEQEQTKGVSKMHWDRDMCSRCVMVISDRKNSVQVQIKDSRKIEKFDDIGCMVFWAEESGVNLLNSESIIWITDVVTGEWIDARKAIYTADNITPMAFGYSAYKSKENMPKDKLELSFDEVYKNINK